MICPNCPVFNQPCAGLTPASDELITKAGQRIFECGEVIFSQHQVSKGVYCIRQGDVILVRQMANQKSIPVAFAHHGELIGASSLTTGAFGNTAEAINKVVTCFIDRSDLVRSDGSFLPPIRFKIMQQVMDDLDYAEGKLASLSSQTNAKRLLNLLVLLAKRTEYGIDIPIDLPVKRLALWLGCTIKSLEKSLDELIKHELIIRSDTNLGHYQLIRPTLVSKLV